MKNKKLLLTGLALTTLASAVTGVHAEEPEENNPELPPPVVATPDDGNKPIFEDKDITKLPVIEDRTGSIEFKYYDDADETVPVEKATFTVYQVAKYGRDKDENGALLPLNDAVDYHDETDAYAYADKVVSAYKLDANVGFKTTVTVENGEAVIKGLPVGAYLIVETECGEYHIKSMPFVCTTPEMNETNDGWVFNTVVEPKANIAGHLDLTKVLKGNNVNKDDTFKFQLSIADGEYKADLPDGTKGTVKNGDIVPMKVGQHLKIYNLPEESEYSIVEIELEDTGYTVTYENAQGKIAGKATTKAVATNTKNSTETGVRNKSLIFAEVGVGAAVVLILLLIIKRKNKEK